MAYIPSTQLFYNGSPHRGISRILFCYKSFSYRKLSNILVELYRRDTFLQHSF